MQNENKGKKLNWVRKGDAINIDQPKVASKHPPKNASKFEKRSIKLQEAKEKKLPSGHFQMVASCFQNLEDVLEQELKDLGAKNVNPVKRAVEFTGDLKLMYKTNVALRTALKVMKPLFSFSAKNDNHIYNNVKEFEWEKIMDWKDTFSIDFAVHSGFFTHSQYVALKMKDAIVDRFKERYGKRPSVEKKQPDFRFHIRVQESNVQISIDSSGDPLFKRGYRRSTNVAPINETLAAGILLKSDWDFNSNFLDPMCGSGTFPIEAALLAQNTPPNLHREFFGFEKWKDFDGELFRDVLKELRNDVKEVDFQIIARDKNSESIRMARENIHAAGLSKLIKLEQVDMFQSKKPFDEGVMFFNPPYGERIQLRDAEGFYAAIGDSLKHDYTGLNSWIISMEKSWLKDIGLKPSKKFELMNGNLKCRLVKYETFEGKRKEMLEKENA